MAAGEVFSASNHTKCNSWNESAKGENVLFQITKMYSQCCKYEMKEGMCKCF